MDHRCRLNNDKGTDVLTSCVREDLENILQADLPWERFAGKRVLVTGAAGFLPAYFVETLLALGALGRGPAEVVGLVRNLPKAKIRFAHHVNRQNLTFLESDLGRPLPRGERFDFVIHGAT